MLRRTSSRELVYFRITDASRLHSFCRRLGESVTVINVVDAMLLKRYLLAENAEDATYNTVWDWNQDETCDVLDVVGLTKFLLRKD